MLAAESGVPVLLPDLLDGSKSVWRGRVWPPEKGLHERQQGWMGKAGRGGYEANGEGPGAWWEQRGRRGGGLLCGRRGKRGCCYGLRICPGSGEPAAHTVYDERM